MDDGTVVALEYERECRRYSEEMFTSFHRGDTYYIFLIGPRDWRTLQALPADGHSCHREHRIIGALCMKNTRLSVFLKAYLTTEVLAVYGYLETRRCTGHVDTVTPVTSSG